MRQWRRNSKRNGVSFWTDAVRGLIFVRGGGNRAPARIEWPKIRINPALKDLELMLLRELAAVSANVAEGNGQILNIRCNYGTTILPSLFGVGIFYMDDEHDTLPASHALPGGADGIRALVEAGVPDFNRGWGPRVFETAAYYREKLKPYPKLSEYIRLYHPDLQGPLDLAEMIWGSGIFMEFYDNPELVKSFLALLTETYRRFMRRWNELAPPLNDRFPAHWGWGHRGKIVLRDDSAMNLSPEMYRESRCRSTGSCWRSSAAAWSISAVAATTTSICWPRCRN